MPSNLAADRFFEHHLNAGREEWVAGERCVRRVPVHRYGYESHQHLFDVDVYPDGTVRYAIDCRTVEGPGPFHLAVLAHFQITPLEAK
jgi:hypothetical protein